MFSPLDRRAGELWSSTGDLIYQPEATPWFRLFNGHDIERWMLKTLLASFHGPYRKQSTGSELQLPAPTRELAEKTVDVSLWSGNAGLYVDSVPVVGEQAAFGLGSNIYRGDTIVAVEFHMFGVRMIFLPCSVDDTTAIVPASAHHRPDGVAFRTDRQRKVVAFSWNHHRTAGGQERFIELRIGPPLPPHGMAKGE
jgi:hypothetical protein